MKKEMFIYRLRLLLTINDFTRDNFSDKIGYSKNTINQWLCGQKEPNDLIIAGIESVMDLPKGFFTSKTLTIHFDGVNMINK